MLPFKSPLENLHHRASGANRSDRDLASKLPIEIWHHILKIAITTRWLPVNFLPPPDNPVAIMGFAYASPILGGIAADVHPESLHFSNATDFMVNRSHLPSNTRHLSIRVLYRMDKYMLNRLEKYKQLRSFAISSSLLGKIREVPFASNLVRLDCTAFEGEEAWLSMKLDAFKNLEELRLRSWETADEVSPTLWAFPGRLASLNEVVFAEALLKLILPLTRLRLLSIRVALDPTIPLVEMVNRHNSSLNHLLPSEGYHRHYSDCPMCTESYDHGAVIRAENTATRILAEGMPNLKRVLWANAWMRHWADERGQRGTNIIRGTNASEAAIKLSRDDGKQV